MTVSLLDCRISPIDVSICLPSHFVQLGALMRICCSNSKSRADKGADPELARASAKPGDDRLSDRFGRDRATASE